MDVLRPRSTLPWRDALRLGFNLALPFRRPAGRRPDLVVGFDFDGFLWPRAAGERYVVSLKGVMADEARFERGIARLRFQALVPLERRNAGRADRVLVTSRYSLERARRAYGLRPGRLRVVPEGIAEDAGGGFDRREAPADRPVILSVARQYRRKNTEALLRALPLVRRRIPEATLRVVGGGPELPRLRRLAAELGLGEAASLLGPLPDRDAVRREYRDADLFCLPTRQEGFGIVFLEAMAAGLPIVAARAGAVPEVAPEGEVSRLVPPDEPDRLAAALVETLLDRRAYARFSAAGRRRWQRFTWPRVAARFLRAARS